MINRLQVGAITSTHGIKGEVKVYPTTDDPKRFEELKQVILETPTGDLTLEIEGVRYFKQFVIVKFKGMDNINQIEKYKGLNLVVTRENAVKLDKDEYFVGDLIGATVIVDEKIEHNGNEDDYILGTLQDVMFTGGNDVYVVITKSGKEVLIPAIKQCILNVDVENNVIEVHLLDGLLD